MNPTLRGIPYLLCLFLLACTSDDVTEVSDEKEKEANTAFTTLPYQSFALADLKAWESSGDNWKIVANVKMNYEEEQNAQVLPGQGVLFNEVNDTAAAHLFSNWKHADLEIEYEAMLPKGSNSGVYFMSRYEIQLLDSWLVEEPQHSDIGGIYQRWDENAPEGQQGYEGHAPRLNAAKAPGLWQKFYVKFTAPRFNAAGEKVSNAKFDKVILNGKVIHENVSLSGPTRAAPFGDEVAAAPLMIQGDHGKVALRNIRYKRYFDEKIALVDGSMAFTYYEIEASTALPDFTSLTPKAEGQIDSFFIEKIAQQEDYFAIQFTGKIQVPKAGDYLFHTISDDGSRLFINGQKIVDNDFNHGDERKSGLINLSEGVHNFQLDYYNNTWGKSLRLLYEGPEIKYQPLASKGLTQARSTRAPMLLDPEEEPELLRSFVMYQGKKRTHAISVGDPAGVHYSLDLSNGNLLKVWRGGFADVSQMYRGRGEAQTAEPQSAATELFTGDLVAALPSGDAPYPSNGNTGFKLIAYDLDNTGRPTFSYRIGDVEIKDRMDPGENKRTLRRTLEFTLAGEASYYHRIAAADYIERLKNGYYNIGGEYLLSPVEGEHIRLRKSGEQMELIVPIADQSRIRYDLMW